MIKSAIILSALFTVSTALANNTLEYQSRGGIAFIEAYRDFSSKELFNSKKVALKNIGAYIASLEQQVGASQTEGIYCSQARVQEALTGLEKVTSTQGDLVIYLIGNTRIVRGYVALLEAKAQKRTDLLVVAKELCGGLND